MGRRTTRHAADAGWGGRCVETNWTNIWTPAVFTCASGQPKATVVVV